MKTWRVVKMLHGILEGIEITEHTTQDACSGQPFTAGQKISASTWTGCGYTILACEEIAA